MPTRGKGWGRIRGRGRALGTTDPARNSRGSKHEELLGVNAGIDQDYSVAPKLGAEPTPIAVSSELQRELAAAGKVVTESEFELRDADLSKVEHVEDEDSDDEGRNVYATDFIRAFSPLHNFIYWTFPISITRSGANTFKIVPSLTNSVGGIGFLASTIFAAILFAATWIGMFSYFLDVPRQNSTGVTRVEPRPRNWVGRAEEVFLLHRNFPTFIVFLTSLFHVVVGNFQFLKKRVEIAEYFTFWTEALQIMKVHAAKGVFFSMTLYCCIFGTFLITLLLMGIFKISPVVAGGPGFVVHVVLRVFSPDFFTMEEPFTIARGVFGVIFIYVFFASKVYVLLYIFQCTVMKNTFKKWSERLDHVVNRSDDYTVRGDRLGKRTGFKELYQDHVVLLDLIDGADMMFGETIESYFTSTTFSLCFECFYLFRALTNREEFPPERQLDALVVGLFFLQSLTILFTAVSVSAEVADTAMEGLEVLRRKGFFGRKSGEELYFLMSLYASYAGAEVTALTGAGYFVLDQSFIVVIIGAFLSYVIILFQFSPPMEFENDRLVPLVMNRGLLLQRVEGIKFSNATSGVAKGQPMFMYDTASEIINTTLVNVSQELLARYMNWSP